MKIAILGNMNNNGFGLLRYFKKIGVDCHLFLLADDGKGAFEHFSIEADTWDYDYWKPYITRTKIYTGYKAIFGSPKEFRLPISRRYIKQLLNGYDVIIGSGSMPALFARHGITLNVFFPYSIGVEYLGNGPTINRLNSPNILLRLIAKYVATLQKEGILNSNLVFNADIGITERNLNAIGVKSKKLPIPMLYLESDKQPPVDHKVRNYTEIICQKDFVIFSHARHLWVKKYHYSDSEWFDNTKNNDWLIHSVAKLKITNPTRKLSLILLEYGDDVDASKELIKNLGICDCVIWLPKMQRKELMYLLSFAHVGVGEFYNTDETLWGGTGWEVLASGKPLLQSFRFTDEKFENTFGYPPPPLLNVKSQKCVTTCLQFAIDNPTKVSEIGELGKNWFNKHNGVNLAKDWLKAIKSFVHE